MNSSFFSGHTSVLLANGAYTPISRLNPGDYVLNMNMEPVKVLKVRQTPKQEMFEVRHQNWYMPTYCTENLQFLTLSEDSNESKDLPEMSWNNVSTLENKFFTSERSVYNTVLPETFSVPLVTPKTVHTLQPTHELGLLFGLFAGYGFANNKIVEFRFGPNDALIQQVSELLQKLLGAETMTEKDEFCFQVKTTTPHVLQLFSDFKQKINRCIPRQYWSKNPDYVQGLFEGLIEYDPDSKISRYIPVSSDMAQIFLWICAVLGLTFENDTARITSSTMRVYPLFVSDRQSDVYMGKVTHVEQTGIAMDCWNLTVDCPTGTFVANNLVVRGETEEEVATNENENNLAEEFNEKAVINSGSAEDSKDSSNEDSSNKDSAEETAAKVENENKVEDDEQTDTEDMENAD